MDRVEGLGDLEDQVEFEEVAVGQNFRGFERRDPAPQRAFAGEFERLADAQIGLARTAIIQETRLKVGVVFQGRLRQGLGLPDPGQRGLVIALGRKPEGIVDQGQGNAAVESHGLFDLDGGMGVA